MAVSILLYYDGGVVYAAFIYIAFRGRFVPYRCALVYLYGVVRALYDGTSLCPYNSHGFGVCFAAMLAGCCVCLMRQ